MIVWACEEPARRHHWSSERLAVIDIIIIGKIICNDIAISIPVGPTRRNVESNNHM